MKNQQGFILPLLLLIVVVGLGAYGYFYLGKDNSQNLVNQAQQIILRQPPGGKTEVQPTSEAQILITKDGFVPQTITVAKDQQVTWVNNDNSNHQIVSQQIELEGEILQPNDSFIFTFEKSGTYKYRDRLNLLKFGGEVIVK